MKLPAGFVTVTPEAEELAIRDYIKPGLVCVLRLRDQYHTMRIESVVDGYANLANIAGPDRIWRSVSQRLLARAFVSGRLTICLGEAKAVA
jgi:hypothetical protein